MLVERIYAIFIIPSAERQRGSNLMFPFSSLCRISGFSALTTVALHGHWSLALAVESGGAFFGDLKGLNIEIPAARGHSNLSPSVMM